jgi:DNA-binding NarL/FixJ family response regulator
MSDRPINVLLVHGHALFRTPLALMLGRQPDFVVAHCGSFLESQEFLNNDLEVDVAILDLDLPDGSALTFIPKITSACERAHAIVLADVINERIMALAIAAGAASALPKTCDVAEVVDAIRRTHAGEALIPPNEMLRLLREAGRIRVEERAARLALDRLTSRELEVLSALAEGLSDKAIARRLGIGDRTVRVHMVNILNKLGVESRLQAVLLAARHGVVRLN